MARVVQQREMHHAPIGHHLIARVSTVILHITAAGMDALAPVFLELGEHLPEVLAEIVPQHRQPPAVGHADDDLLRPQLAEAIGHELQQRHRRLTTLNAEPLLAEEPFGEERLELLDRRELLQQPHALGVVQPLGLQVSLKAPPEPRPLIVARDVHKLHTDGAAVRLLQMIDDHLQRRRAARHQVGMDRLAQGRLRKPEVIQRERLWPRPRTPERVDRGNQMTKRAICADQILRRALQHGPLPIPASTARAPTWPRNRQIKPLKERGHIPAHRRRIPLVLLILGVQILRRPSVDRRRNRPGLGRLGRGVGGVGGGLTATHWQDPCR